MLPLQPFQLFKTKNNQTRVVYDKVVENISFAGRTTFGKSFSKS
jgi:hypothetical protein